MTDKEKTAVVKKKALAETKMAVEAGDVLGVPPAQLVALIKHQVITVPKGDPPPTDAELAMVLGIVHGAGLNPLSGDIYAWRDNKGKMCVQPSPDGWVKTGNNNPDFYYMTYEEGPIVPSPDGEGEECFEWVRAIIHTRDGHVIPQPKTWLKEWYVPQRGNYKGMWQKQTKYRIGVVAHRLGIRYFCGLGGSVIIDEEQPFYQNNRPSMQDMTEQATEDMVADAANQTGKPNAAMWEATMAGEPVEAEFEEADPPPPVGHPALPLEEADPDSEDFVPCGIRNCSHDGSRQCLMCGGLFCLQHCPEGECAVCREGGNA